MSSGHTVGYKKPPVSGQFKKGKSGNPKGRVRGSTSMKGVFQEVLQEPVRVRQGDQQKSVPRLRAMFMALLQKAMGGDTKAIQLVLRTADTFQVLLPAPGGAEPLPFAWMAEDEAYLQQFIKGDKIEATEPNETMDPKQNESPETEEPEKS